VAETAPQPDPTPQAATEFMRRMRALAATPPEGRRAEAHRTGEALRAIVHRLHGSDAPAEALAEVADALEQLVADLAAFPSGSAYEGFSEATLAGRDPAAFFDQSPMLGIANPLAPPIRLWEEEDGMHGIATFGAAYEGPPGCVHGGYVAAAFDELLGATQSLGGRPGMTGRLAVDYRSPTPLNAELRLFGRVVRVEGRKTITYGTLHAGDRICAESEALFVAIDMEKFSELRRLRPERMAP
jgi:acyl-coenzyme A thioesterase PaaI-like protein